MTAQRPADTSGRLTEARELPADAPTGTPTPADARTDTPAPADARTDTPARPRELTVPALSLVVLVGISGSGKSTFAREHFGPFETVSSDVCRGLVSGDENDQDATADAFELLDHIVALRLRRGLLTVVDATNVQAEARAKLVALARAHDVLPVAIVLDMPESLCRARNAARPERAFGAHVLRRQREQLRRSVRRLNREGFRAVHVLSDPDQASSARVVRTPLVTDRRFDHGPFDVVGDVHGCIAELVELLTALGYDPVRDEAGRAVDALPPAGRTAVFLGDLVDRGPDSVAVLRLVMGMCAAGHALAVPGNHEDKLVRMMSGKGRGEDAAATLAAIDAEGPEFREQVHAFARGLVSHLILDDGKLVVAHAGLKEAYQGRASGRVRAFALYGDVDGTLDADGLPLRRHWELDYRGSAAVLYGHTPVAEARWVNNTLCLDTGCVYGGKLSALRYPERDLVQVDAHRVWREPPRPLRPVETRQADDGKGSGPGPGHPSDGGAGADGEASRASTRPATEVGSAVGPGGVGVGPAVGPGPAPERPASDLPNITDVTGKRVVHTAHHGRITIREENAAGALEVMGRFALEPRRLVYLPPTMSPCATSRRPGLLEHPAEAFAGYAADGVAELICQEKHMGSRAVVLLCRTAQVAADRFGITGTLGTVHTRTGRAFFEAERTGALLERLARAAEKAGTWDRVDGDWVLLDCELLPWSVKAESLLRDQYAAVGAAARGSLPVALEVLEATSARLGADGGPGLAEPGADGGSGLAGLAARTAVRASDAEAYAAAYRRYRWPTDGIDGVRLAPFQVLASGSATYHDRPHAWHLQVADALAAADPDLVRRTARLEVDAADPASVAAGIAWWEELTGAGGEGMVVKPAANLVRTARGLAQPGVKVRGWEYLRIIYGPDYTVEANLERLRSRSLGRKRSLALREYALGLEALERLTRGEPTWRVHEAVFAVLALESEPVDPRL